MTKKNDVCISYVRFPWETFGAQAEREAREAKNDGDRWIEEFLAEVRSNIEIYAAEPDEALRNCLLNDVWNLTPVHFRRELFAGISFPVWEWG